MKKLIAIIATTVVLAASSFSVFAEPAAIQADQNMQKLQQAVDAKLSGNQ